MSDLLALAHEVKYIKKTLQIKDMEIGLLNEEVKTAFSTIETLTKRIHELENAQHKPNKSDSEAAPSSHLLTDLTLSSNQMEQRNLTLEQQLNNVRSQHHIRETPPNAATTTEGGSSIHV